MTPVEQVLAEARRYIGVTETPPGSNRGVEVDYFIRETGLDPKLGLPWCAAFVHQIGRQALGAAWPVPRTASVAAIERWATAQGVIRDTAAVGDLFLLWHAELKRFAHVGFIEATLDGGRFATLEGNTNPGGSREGFGVFRRQRTFGLSTRFVRWTQGVPHAPTP
jgi:hypothetical protein